MQAISTKYLSATNYRGSRIKAECDRGSITISYDDALSGDAVHFTAVQALVERFVREDEKQYGTPPAKNPWARDWISGGIIDGRTVFVPVDGDRHSVAI